MNYLNYYYIIWTSSGTSNIKMFIIIYINLIVIVIWFILQVEFSAAETQFTAVTQLNNGNVKIQDDAKDQAELEPMQRRTRKQSKPMSLKDKTLYANIRTAAMLFVVTVVFLIAFLPAWLMAHDVISYNEIIFYMYFIYNTANPFIYAFMNKSFRDDLSRILKFA